MRKKLVYMVVDTETATLPFANEIANNDPELKKKIAIARPLVYDIGWTLMYRDGTVFEKKQFLVTETFSVPAVFNTAYYASKRPLYLAMMERGEIECLPWNTIMEAFIADLEKCDYVGAFNSMFDFKKAIPFTELYIKKLYSPEYFDWEKIQYAICERIAAGVKMENNNDFDKYHFVFRDGEYDLFDVWGLAADRLLNKKAYKEKCLELGMLSASGDYFKTSAEACFRYICSDWDFEEAHTALADAEIESAILAKILTKGKIDLGIGYFPFRTLGNPFQYVSEMPDGAKRRKFAKTVHDAYCEYCGLYSDEPKKRNKNYDKTMAKIELLREMMGE